MSDVNKNSKIITDEVEFRFHVVNEIGNIKTRHEVLANSVANMEDHLKRQNGNIARLFTRTEENYSRIMKHQRDCPLNEDVSRLKQIVNIFKNDENVRNQWKSEFIIPFVRAAAIAIIGILLLIIGAHFNEIKNLL